MIKKSLGIAFSLTNILPAVEQPQFGEKASRSVFIYLFIGYVFCLNIYI